MALSVTVDKNKVEDGDPKLVIRQDGGIILVDNWSGDSELFSGTLLNHIISHGYNVGDYVGGWKKSYVKPFYGKITLEQTS